VCAFVRLFIYLCYYCFIYLFVYFVARLLPCCACICTYWCSNATLYMLFHICLFALLVHCVPVTIYFVLTPTCLFDTLPHTHTRNQMHILCSFVVVCLLAILRIYVFIVLCTCVLACLYMRLHMRLRVCVCACVGIV